MDLRRDFFGEASPCEESVKRLGALPHNLHGNAAWAVSQVNAGGQLVYVLSAGSRGSRESFLDIFFPYAEPPHFPLECRLFFL